MRPDGQCSVATHGWFGFNRGGRRGLTVRSQAADCRKVAELAEDSLDWFGPWEQRAQLRQLLQAHAGRVVVDPKFRSRGDARRQGLAPARAARVSTDEAPSAQSLSAAAVAALRAETAADLEFYQRAVRHADVRLNKG